MKFVTVRRTRRTLLPLLGLSALSVLAASGCSDSPAAPTPTPTGPAVRSISPSTGTTFGGTAVTITGQRFAAGATVTIGGAPATNVVVEDASTVKATTPAHAAGSVEVIVTQSNGASTLPQAFAFVAPSGTNTPPVITSLTAQGTKPNEPAAFADLDEEIAVTAVVQDAETPADQLTYQWSASAGTFTGTGSAVTWRAPSSDSGPRDVVLTLTVIESYKTPDPNGLPIPAENKTSSTTSVSVHNSVKESGDVAWRFLLDFSDSRVPASTAVRNFSTRKCGDGAAAELSDVTVNRKRYHINSSAFGQPSVAIDFGSFCPFRSKPGDACVTMSCKWNSTVIDPTATDFGKIEDAKGVCFLTTVYDDGVWRLCWSDWDGITTSGRRWMF